MSPPPPSGITIPPTFTCANGIHSSPPQAQNFGAKRSNQPQRWFLRVTNHAIMHFVPREKKVFSYWDCEAELEYGETLWVTRLSHPISLSTPFVSFWNSSLHTMYDVFTVLTSLLFRNALYELSAETTKWLLYQRCAHLLLRRQKKTVRTNQMSLRDIFFCENSTSKYSMYQLLPWYLLGLSWHLDI